RGVIAAHLGGAPLRRSGCSRHAARARAGAGPRRTVAGAVSAIGVVAVDAVVDVVVGIGPEVVVGVGPIHVIEHVVVGVGPEQRPDPADDEAGAPPRPARPTEPRRAPEAALEAGRREVRAERRVGDGAVAEGALRHGAPGDRAARHAAYAAMRSDRPDAVRGGSREAVAAASDPRGRDAGAPGEAAASD